MGGAPTATLEIRLLGRFALAASGRPFEIHMAGARLLAYLALAGGRPVARPRAAGALWPDLSERRARANLSTVAWRLRQALAVQDCRADVVGTSEDALRLAIDLCDVDVEQFRRYSFGPGDGPHSLEALGRAVQALELYRGDLLEDWDAEWCELEREHLRQRRVHTLRTLAEAFGRRGRPDLGLHFAWTAAAADPLNETVQRILMRLLFLTGDRASAVSQFRRFAHLARSELGVGPAEETAQLFDEIRGRSKNAGPEGGPHAGASLVIRPEHVGFIGRAAERDVIGALLHGATDGRGGGLLIVGEAGIGKSRLADWAMEEWASRGGDAVRGRCVEFNDPIPYQPLLDALAAHVDSTELNAAIEDQGLPPVMVPAEGTDRPGAWPAGKLRLFNWLRSRLDTICRRRPLLVAIEDLQWADAGTFDFLAYLLERSRQMRLALLLTSRPPDGRAPGSARLARLTRYCATVLRLGPLTEGETADLVRALLDAPRIAAGLLSWIYAETEGNPLFVVETLRLLRHQDRIGALPSGSAPASAGVEGAGPTTGIPDGIRSAIRQRLALIEEPALRVAQAASVLGRRFDEDLLAAVARIGSNRLSRAVDRLVTAGVLEREGGTYRFSHDKIRAVCYEDLQVGSRRDYHVRAAAALAHSPDLQMHRLAWHQSSAGQWHLAATSWARAGDQARDLHAYEEALRAYRHAVSCVQRDATRAPAERQGEEIELLLKGDAVLAILGRPEERRGVLERIGVLCGLAGGPSPIEARWLIRRALLAEHVGDFEESALLARRAWRVARSGGQDGIEAEALRVLAWALNRAGRDRRSLAVSKLALRRTGPTPSPLQAAVLREMAFLHLKLNAYAAGLECLQAARTILAGLGSADEDPHILTAEAIALKWHGATQASRAKFTKAEQSASRMGDLVLTARTRYCLATLDALEARPGDALRRLRSAKAASLSTGYNRTLISCLNEVANGVGRQIGNYHWAHNALSWASELARSTGSNTLLIVLRDSQAQVLQDEGRLAEALAAANSALELVEHGRGAVGPHHESLSTRGAIRLALGDCERAVEDLETAGRAQRRTGDRLVLVDTLTHLALAYARLGDGRALSTSEEAILLLSEIGYANHQPQRIFWHHYRILEIFDRTPRLLYLRRAVEFIEAQAATLSVAQARRLRLAVRINREILDAWAHRPDGATGDA